MFQGQVGAREDSGRLVLSGALARWTDIVLAGRIAAKDNPYIGLVNEIRCTGERPMPVRMPSVEDGALEWEEPDVLIIGGGVIGCAIARELSRYKLDILLVEKESDLAMHTSSRNDGIVHSGIDLKKGTQKYKYNKLGNRMFDKVCAELGVDFKRCGQYLCLSNRLWEPLMFLSQFYWKWLGMNNVRVIGKAELHKIEPSITPNIGAAFFFPDTGIVCPYSLTIAYAENAVDNGVTVSLDTMVLGMKSEDGFITSVKTNRGTIIPKVVINAAGVFCEDIAAMAGDRFYSIHPRKGTNIILDKKHGDVLVRTAVSSLGTSATRKRHTKGGAVLRTVEGNTLVGPDAVETMHKEDFTTIQPSIKETFKRQSRTNPALDENQIINYFSGIRAATYEEDFVVCPGKFVRNMVHAAGIQSPGLTAAPAIGADVAQMVVKLFGGEEEVEINPDFNPVRTAPPRVARMSDNERSDLIDRNPDYGMIVCRCEEISRGEILEAMRRNIPCTTIDGIKRRVRPGMGRCQGGFCGPQIVEIIAKELRIQPHQVKKSGDKSELLYGPTKTYLSRQPKSEEPKDISKTDPELADAVRERAKEMLLASYMNKKDGE